MPATAPIQIIIFGASGDLTARKLVPALAQLAARGAPDFHLIGVARRPLSDEAFRELLRGRLDEGDRAAFEALAERIHYLSGDVGSEPDLAAISARLDALPGGSAAGRLFYLSLKPDLFIPAVENLGRAGLLQQADPADPWRRVVVEKPFGHDLDSAQTINRALHDWLREDQL